MALKLTDWGSQSGYKTNWDSNSGMVSVTDPNTNRQISFKAGQGQNYGITSNQNADTHWVANPDVLVNKLKTANPQGYSANSISDTMNYATTGTITKPTKTAAPTNTQTNNNVVDNSINYATGKDQSQNQGNYYDFTKTPEQNATQNKIQTTTPSVPTPTGYVPKIVSYSYNGRTFGNAVNIADAAKQAGMTLSKNSEGDWTLNGNSIYSYSPNGYRQDDSGNIYFTAEDAQKIFGGGQVTSPTQAPQAAEQQVQPSGPVALRATAEGQEIPIAWDEASGKVTINGVPADLSELKLINKSWTGDAKAVQNTINKAMVGYNPETKQIMNGYAIRDYFGKDVMVGFSNGQVTLDGIPIDTSKMALIDGKFYATPENIKAIEAQLMQRMGVGGGAGAKGNSGSGAGADVYQQDYIESIQADYEKKIAEYDKKLVDLTSGLGNYKSELETEILSTIRDAYGDPYKYDPNADPALRSAMAFAETEIINDMAARGLLNSSITTDRLAKMKGEMISKYETLAFDRYNKNIDNMLKKADVLMKLSQDDYTRYKDFVTESISTIKDIKKSTVDTAKDNMAAINDAIKNQLEAEKIAITAQKNEVEAALDRVKLRGFVGVDAKILGIDPQTLSYEAQKAANDKIDKLEMMEEEYNYKLKEYNAQLTNDTDKIQFEWDLKADERKAKAEADARQQAETTRHNQQLEAQSRTSNSIAQGNLDARNTEVKRQESLTTQKEAKDSYDELDKYIQNTYTKENKDKRRVMTVQDKEDINKYTATLDSQGVPDEVVDSLRLKYGLPALPR